MTVLVGTTEDSGMDRYSREIARFLPVEVAYISRYRSGLRALRLVRKLVAQHGAIHFSNQHFGRYALITRCPYIVTVHDLVRLCFPFSRENPKEAIRLKFDTLGIKRASHIVAVSHNTKRDMVTRLGIPEHRITVIHNGVNHGVFKPGSSRPFPFPYLLYVGSERPRKNLSRLLSAFAQLKRGGDFPDLKLIKVGKPGRSVKFRRNTLRTIEELGLGDEVLLVEDIGDEELATYYSSASALVYPSLYEGFGLPVVEAMACHCPVVTSNVSSLLEVAGDASILVDPQDVDGLHLAMARLLTDAELREQLVAKGREHARKFSWYETAMATLDVYKRVQAGADQRTGYIRSSGACTLER
ncbi:MAG: glycosyltransferase family 1 protein [Dehalococcoidia bacterium]|jgi:glycosyltransferase involved in cell wall biosynthesis|nr:glycosyltransferase family 1 protein [Dehalococcoidia bacterium]MDP7469449.1 glycosyltransferase family 1 protein [Dehalococcoidia bacterium]